VLVVTAAAEETGATAAFRRAASTTQHFVDETWYLGGQHEVISDHQQWIETSLFSGSQ